MELISSPRVHAVEALLDQKMSALREHPYFVACRNQELSRGEFLEIVQQLYCFSVLFERIITRRLASTSSRTRPELLDMARAHLREEIGHAALIRGFLERNGLRPEQIQTLMPRASTKAVFGYLLATVEYESELVANVAIMQVMELIGLHFFGETLAAMRAQNLPGLEAFVVHSEDDENHSKLGLEFLDSFDEETMRDSIRVIHDLFRLMGYVFDEWLACAREGASHSVGHYANALVSLQ